MFFTINTAKPYIYNKDIDIINDGFNRDSYYDIYISIDERNKDFYSHTLNDMDIKVIEKT